MHYTGMAAASYVYEPGKAIKPTKGMSGDMNVSMMGAVGLGLALCLIFLWVMATLNLADLRRWNHYNEELIKQVDALVSAAENSKAGSAQALELLIAGYMKVKHRRDVAISLNTGASKKRSFGVNNSHSNVAGEGNGSFFVSKPSSKVCAMGEGHHHDKASIAVVNAIEGAKIALEKLDHDYDHDRDRDRHNYGNVTMDPSSSRSRHHFSPRSAALQLQLHHPPDASSPQVLSSRVTPTSGRKPTGEAATETATALV
jgi:hypothetical protein